MNYCVLVKVSKHEVAFWYQLENSPYTPLIINESNVVPLYFYVNDHDIFFGNVAREKFFSCTPNSYGNYFEIIKDPSKHFSISSIKKPVKQLLYYGIEQYLSHFINTVLYKSDSIESFRQNFPLRFFFESDVEDKEKTLIEKIFTEAGYDNVDRIDYAQSLFEVLSVKGIINTNNSFLLLKGIDNNLYIELYKNLTGIQIGVSKLDGQGADPRVKILAEMIIEDILAVNPYLSINTEDEIATLLPFSAELLANKTPILKGEALLTDSKLYYFEVKTSILNDRLMYVSNDNIIYQAINSLLEVNSISLKNTTIVLGSKEINTAYITNKLLKICPNVIGVEAAHFTDAMK